MLREVKLSTQLWRVMGAEEKEWRRERVKGGQGEMREAGRRVGRFGRRQWVRKVV